MLKLSTETLYKEACW